MVDGLLLLAHGSPDPRHAAAIDRLAASVRAGHDGPVCTAFLEHDRPNAQSAAKTLASDGADRLIVIPLLLAAGYHGTSDLPRAAEEAAAAGLPVLVADVLGPDPRLALAVRQRIADGRVDDAALVVAHAGTPGSASSRLAEAVAADLGATVADGIADVGPALARVAGPAVVVRLLLADGVLGDRLRDTATAHGARSIGRLADAPAIADLVRHRAHVACGLPGSPGAPPAA